MADIFADRKRRRTLENLVYACEAWKRAYRPTCREALLQVDSVNEALPDLAEAIGNVLGWWEEPEDRVFERTPAGHINNCALANGDLESNCQICKGNCPDKEKFNAR